MTGGLWKRVKETLALDESVQQSTAREDTNSKPDDYDGPRFGEPVKITLMFGPEEGVGVMPIREGGIYITPQTAYQRRDGDYVELDADVEPLFRAMAVYVDPQEIREQQLQQEFDL